MTIEATDYVVRESGFLVRAGTDVELRERIAELELAQEDAEWELLGPNGEFEFSRRFVTTVTRLARLMFLKNPLIFRGVEVKANYIFGRGVNIRAQDATINDVIQRFLDDEHNQTEFTSHISRLQREKELQIEGNIFFVLVPHIRTGHVRVHSIPVDEITDVITNPNNRKEPWFYRREWIERKTNLSTGATEDNRKVAYYQDYRYRPENKITSIGDHPVVENQFVYHLKVGGFSDWKFGVSEIYSALDWAKAYRQFLANWSTIVAAYASFAFVITTTGGKQGVSAAKSKLASTISTTTGERNPAPAKGSNIIMQEGNTIDPIRTAGATTKAEDGRRLLLMICAGFGLPETFFGDVSVGTLATARSLDRPTQLMLGNRQVYWADVYHDILDFVIRYAVIATEGPLRGYADVEPNEYNEDVVIFDPDIVTHIDVDFPNIVEPDMTALITAIKTAATFDGQTPTIIPDAKLLARMVLVALGENDVDELIEQLYPENTPEPAENDDPALDTSTDGLAQAANDLKLAIEALHESLKLQQ